MRTWWLVALALAGCKKQGASPAAGSGSGSGSEVAAPVTAPADALTVPDASIDATIPVDAAVPDAARVTEADTEHLLDWETIGALKLRLDEAVVVKTLGPPQQKGFPEEEGATGDFVGEWTWPGVAIGMAGDKRSGPFHVRSIQVTAPSKLATSRGIHIGSTLAEVRAIYPRNTEEGNADPNQYLVGSVYGGELFTLKDGKVESIFLGAMAF